MEKYTKEQLNAMDKEALIQLLYNTQQLLETLVKQNQELTETIALMNQRQFGRKSEKNLVTKDQITIFDMGVNEKDRSSCIIFWKRGRAAPSQGPSRRGAGDARRPAAPKGRILVNGLGCGTGRLPGVSGCDILELRIWYKNRSTAVGLALPDVGAERILFF